MRIFSASLSLLVASCGSLAATVVFATSEPKVYALVIGIDEYEHIGSLAGAVNDAKDIAAALSALPMVDLTMLLNGDATRDAILEEWRAKALSLEPGDTMIVSYAGHGGNEPEAYAGNEIDGRDETFLLSKFYTEGDAARHRIRDDEVAELLGLVPQDATMILVADSCHSGTVIRSVRNVHSYRYFSGGTITDDPLPPPPPNTRPDDVIGENTIFLSAVADDEQAPEFLIEDEVRGALSIAFAEAMRGDADKNRDGVLSKGELEGHIRETVKSISSGIQNPQIGPIGQINRGLLTLRQDTVATLDPIVLQNPFRRTFEELPPQKLWSSAGQALDLAGAIPTVSEDNANLIVDFTQHAVFSSIGDQLTALPVAAAPASGLVQRMIEQQRVIAEIRAYDPLQPLDIFFQGGNGTYFEADRVVAHVAGRETERVWLLHFSSDGSITHLFPLEEFDDPETTEPSNTLAIPLAVTPPFGADTVIAIEAANGIPALDQALEQFDGSNDVAGLWNALNAAMGDRDDVAASVFSFFTTERPN